MNDGISIIIPTFNVPEFLDECLESIFNQKTNINYEIIVGIDNCEKTLEHIKNKQEFYKKIKVFYFNEKVGPYVIKNNLIRETRYNNLLFFDSDDIMNDSLLEMINPFYKTHDVVRFNFQNFNIVKDNINLTTIENSIGVFGIKKKIFEDFNGFENWICQADSEFKRRTEYVGVRTMKLEEVIFKRRIHENNLTRHKNTNMKSSLRYQYIKEIKIKPKDRNPDKLTKQYDLLNEILFT